MTLAELDKLNEIEIENADKTKLVDIQTIHINPAQSAQKRVESYLKQIKNPYLFLFGDMAVKVSFDENGRELKHKLKSYFANTKKG